jgi:hypothetical protein
MVLVASREGGAAAGSRIIVCMVDWKRHSRSRTSSTGAQWTVRGLVITSPEARYPREGSPPTATALRPHPAAHQSL